MSRKRKAQGTDAAEPPPARPPARLRTDALAVAALLVAHVAFFLRAIVLRGLLVQSDILYFFEPAKAFMHEALRAGRLPLWSPYIYCGYPIAAEGQIAAFYPLGLLISWLLPSPDAINWLVVSHLMIVAVGMYLLARFIGLGPVGSWLSGFVVSFSGFLFAHLHHISLICAAAWLPWVVLFTERAWRGRLLPNAVGAAVAWGLGALCGHPQTLFHTSLLALFWVVWRLVSTRRLSNLQSPISRPLTRAICLAAVIFTLGIGISAVQLLLTSDLSKLAPHGDRGTLQYVTSFSLLPAHLLGLIAPNWQGTPAYNTYRGERYYWEYVLYIGLAPLALAVLAATRRRCWVWAWLALASLALALAQGNPVYQVLRFVPGFSDFRVPARYLLIFTFAAALLAGYGWETLAALRPFAPGRRRHLAGAALILLTIADLFVFDRTLAPLAGPDVFSSTPQIVNALRQDATWHRSMIVTPIPIYADWSPPGGWAGNPGGWLEARVCLPADVPQSFDLPIVYGYAGFVDPSFTQFFDEATRRAQTGDYTLYSLVGTRYFAVPPTTTLLRLPAADVPPFRLYLNQDAFPRAFLTDRQPTDLSSEATSVGEVTSIQQPRPERATIRVRAGGDALLVFNERWDPGWRALVDGKPAPLRKADPILMATAISRGEHTVEFVYQPRGLIVGRAISFGALALCLLLLILSSATGRKRVTAEVAALAG